MYKMVLILPYFGNLPTYFQLFLLSCKNNPTINWIIYTDNEIEMNYPNIKIIKTSFKDFSERFRKHFPFPIKLNRPYKLCDFKPSYGEVLQDDISMYDFWGHCDCDLIFGNIRKFVTEDILQNNNKIYLHGHFTLYHNDSTTNSFYRRQNVIDVKSVFNDERIFAFDEGPGMSSIWSNENLPFYFSPDFDDIYVRKYQFFPTKKFFAGGMYQLMNHIIYQYENSTLFRVFEYQNNVQKEEILYVHFQKRTMAMRLSPNESFLAVPNKFIPNIDSISLRLIRKLSAETSIICYIANMKKETKHFLYVQKEKLGKMMKINN